MSSVLPSPAPPRPADRLTGRPSTRSLLRWGALVGVLHLFFLMSLASTLDLQLSGPQTLRTGPMQTRTLANSAHGHTAIELPPFAAARTRVAWFEKPQPAMPDEPSAPTPAADFQTSPSHHTLSPLGPTEADLGSVTDPALHTATAHTQPLPVPESDAQPHPDHNADPLSTAATAAQAQATVLAAQDSTASVPTAHQMASMTDSDAEPVPALTDTPRSEPPPPTPTTSKAEGVEPLQNSLTSISSNPASGAPFATPAPERIASATMALPAVALGSLPPSALLIYRLHGQEKGIAYQASGELRWQHNASDYAMSLSVKAFLLGARHWRSVGQINASGLAPTRFSDSWRSERAAHFDRPNQRIVFSNNAPTTPLQPGAQDQVSLYPQLAAAMTQSGQRMQPGTRLQIQTVTVRDALPWLLTLEKVETLQMDGKSVQAVKWVCQPRNRFDAQVEFWVSAAHDWLPARIRITQVSGSFIDLQLTGKEALADLPPVQ